MRGYYPQVTVAPPTIVVAPRNMLTLALDLGTSSCRSALFDVRGRRLLDTTAQQSYPLQTDKVGKAELDPTTVLQAYCRPAHQDHARDPRR